MFLSNLWSSKDQLHLYLEKNLPIFKTTVILGLKSNTYKDIANQLYGKSIERVRDRLKLHFCRTYWQFNRLQNITGFRGCKIVSPYLVLVFMTPTEIQLNKPLQIGATILEHSKVSLLSFFS